MSELDLQPLIDAAIVLDQEDREMRDCEARCAAIERGVPRATPSSLEGRLRDLGRIAARSDMARWAAPALWETMRTRIERKTDHPEVMALMEHLLTQAHDMRQRLVRLRRGIRDLEMVVLGATKDLQQQSVDSRLLRLVADEYRGMTLAEIHETVEKDHAAIADAIATWKLAYGAGAVLSIRDTSTIDEVHQALRRLEGTGHASRTGTIFTTARWTVTGEPADDRKRA